MNNENKGRLIVVHLLSAIYIVGMGFAVAEKSQQNYFGKNGELQYKDYTINQKAFDYITQQW